MKKVLAIALALTLILSISASSLLPKATPLLAAAALLTSLLRLPESTLRQLPLAKITQ